MGLCYVFGAAVMHFQLPSCDFLEQAFIGGQAWVSRASPPPRPQVGNVTPTNVAVDQPGKTFDGFTLCTTTGGSSAALLDMRGNVVHRWQMPFSRAWPKPIHVASPSTDERIHWFRCHLYPNGDLLAIYHAEHDTPYGYGLVKLDEESNLLWAYGDNVHHDIDIDENDRIYTLTQNVTRETPAGLAAIPSPFLADCLVVLSADGRELDRFPLLDAFRDSPYALTLASIYNRPPKAKIPTSGLQLPPGHGDIIHANSVKVLPRSLAPHFPLFKAGQVLISLRTLDTLAILDLDSRSVVWATSGLWRGQHDAQFLANGHLLVFDNLGSGNQVRVLEYDPVRQAYPWSYVNHTGTGVFATQRGMAQRLPNGNTLIVSPDDCRLIEVTPDQELVWECSTPSSNFSQGSDVLSHAILTGAQRYAAAELSFLKGDVRVRP
jgi:hypothetical protein